jgi:hypothetical protein
MKCDFIMSNGYLRATIIQCGTRQCSWLRHSVASQNIAGSIPDEVTGFLIGSNLPSRITDLELTQHLTEMSTTNLPGGKG